MSRPTEKAADIAWDQLLPANGSPPSDDAELLASVGARGILEPLIVRPAAPDGANGASGFAEQYEIVEGRRRWHAVATLIETGRWAPDATLPCLIVNRGGEEGNVQRK